MPAKKPLKKSVKAKAPSKKVVAKKPVASKKAIKDSKERIS